MSFTIGKTYTDITVDKGTDSFEFPASITGTIRPGTLDGVSCNIKWGVNMTQPIEPGTITGLAGLMFDETYKHPIDDTIVPKSVPLYIHESNAHLGPVGGPFFVWRRDRGYIPGEHNVLECLRAADIDSLSPGGKTTNFKFIPNGPIYIASVSRKLKPITVEAVPESTPEAKTTDADIAVLKAQVAELQATVAKLTKVIDLSALKID